MTRSFADPLSSALHLGPLDTERLLIELSVKRRLPLKVLPVLMHELTHQWCFNSVVGRTIVLLLFRAQRGAASGAPAAEIERDLARAELAQRALLPLAEGLALFAEHDLYPGRCESTARPLMQCAPLVMHNRGAERIPPEAVFANLSLLLFQSRSTRRHVDRKASLLIEPMECRRSVYLVGYLAVKTLHLLASLRLPRASESDLFLQLAYAHFYEDWSLAGLLLDDSILIDDLPDALVRYTRERLVGFARAIDDPSVADFERRSRNLDGSREVFEHVVQGTLRHRFFVDHLKPSSNRALGEQRLAALMDSALALPQPGDDASTSVVAVHQVFHAAAQALTLGSTMIRGRRLGGHILLSTEDGTPIGAFPAQCELPLEWEGEVRVVALFVVEVMKVVVMAFDGARRVTSFGLEDLLKEDIEQGGLVWTFLDNPLTDPVQRRAAADSLGKLVRAVLGPGTSLSRARVAIDDTLDTTYLAVAGSCHADPALGRGLLEAIGETSFLTELGDDLDAVEKLAQLSLIGSAPFDFACDPATKQTLLARAASLNESLKATIGGPVLPMQNGEWPFHSRV